MKIIKCRFHCISVFLSILAVPGCTDTGASNYDSEATEDDASCTYRMGLKNCCRDEWEAQEHWKTEIGSAGALKTPRKKIIKTSL